MTNNCQHNTNLGFQEISGTVPNSLSQASRLEMAIHTYQRVAAGLRSRIQGRALFRYCKDLPRRTPNLLHFAHTLSCHIYCPSEAVPTVCLVWKNDRMESTGEQKNHKLDLVYLRDRARYAPRWLSLIL